MNVKIIGGSGFVGRHLAKKLLSAGHRYVTVVDSKKSIISGSNVYNPTSGEGSWYNDAHFIGCDVTDYQDVYYAIDKSDFVVHLAAVSQFASAEANPHVAAAVNITGTANVAQACIDNRASRLVYASTGSVYSRDATVPIDEEQSTGPASVYGWTKLAGEYFVKMAMEKMSAAILRLPHIVGPGKLWGANSFITKMLNNERPTIFGHGNNTNDFTYVDDIVQAIELALVSRADGIYNIGSGKARTTNDFFTVSRAALDKMHIEPLYAPPRGADFPNFEYNISKAQTVLGYKPRYSLEDAIAKTVLEWQQWL